MSSPISCYTHVLPARLGSPVSPAHFSSFPPPSLCPYCALCTADLLEPLQMFESSFGNRSWCTQGCLPTGADPQSKIHDVESSLIRDDLTLRTQSGKTRDRGQGTHCAYLAPNAQCCMPGGKFSPGAERPSAKHCASLCLCIQL